jgi:hypothetical protein
MLPHVSNDMGIYRMNAFWNNLRADLLPWNYAWPLFT